MKIPTPERFTLPLSAAGERLATALCDAIKAWERTVTVRHELMEMESEGGRLNVPLLIVEAGPRPREGQIANHLKHTASKTLETRTEATPRIPELGERERAYVRSAEANWLKMSTTMLRAIEPEKGTVVPE